MRRALEHLPAAVRAHGHVGVQDPCSWSLGGRGDRLGGRCHDRRSGCCGPRLQQGRLSAARGRIPVHTEVYFPFLDEAPEFKRGVLQSLRQPLEAGEVVVARARGSVRYPARFQLVLAANPCPCGLSFGKARNCRCRSQQKRDYLSRLSGPLLDRIDLRVVVDSVRVTDLALPRGDDSATVAQRVRQARGAQEERWVAYPWKLNSEVPGPRLREAPWRLASSAVADLDRELDLGVLTLRGYDRVLRLAWTLTDLRGGAGAPTRDDIGAALTMRGQDVAA